MTSLPDALGDKCPVGFREMWTTCVNAATDDEAPWLVLADACDEWRMHGLAAACRAKADSRNWRRMRTADKSALIVAADGWWSVRYRGSEVFNFVSSCNASWADKLLDRSRAEQVFRGDGLQ